LRPATCCFDWDFLMRRLFLSRNIKGATDAGRGELRARAKLVHPSFLQHIEEDGRWERGAVKNAVRPDLWWGRDDEGAEVAQRQEEEPSPSRRVGVPPPAGGASAEIEPMLPGTFGERLAACRQLYRCAHHACLAPQAGVCYHGDSSAA
jgi:hypothetical protein